MTDLADPPEVVVSCPQCAGEGANEIPRPFPDDPFFCIVVPCEACGGAGFRVEDAPGDPPDFAEDDCPGHVASAGDPKTCGRCGVHIDSLRPD